MNNVMDYSLSNVVNERLEDQWYLICITRYHKSLKIFLQNSSEDEEDKKKEKINKYEKVPNNK